jgi:hypothetical protein
MHRGTVEQAVQFDQLRGAGRVMAEGEASKARKLDPTYYRERAKAWREKAIVLPEDHAERAVCVEIAEGYDKLATLIEQREAGRLLQPEHP